MASFFVGGSCPATVGYSAPSLVWTHFLPIATTQNISRYCQMSPGWQNRPRLRARHQNPLQLQHYLILKVNQDMQRRSQCPPWPRKHFCAICWRPEALSSGNLATCPAIGQRQPAPENGGPEAQPGERAGRARGECETRAVLCRRFTSSGIKQGRRGPG